MNAAERFRAASRAHDVETHLVFEACVGDQALYDVGLIEIDESLDRSPVAGHRGGPSRENLVDGGRL